MQRLPQKLVLAGIILSCGFIFSLSSAPDRAQKQEEPQQAHLTGKPHLTGAPARVVVYYAKDYAQERQVSY